VVAEIQYGSDKCCVCCVSAPTLDHCPLPSLVSVGDLLCFTLASDELPDFDGFSQTIGTVTLGGSGCVQFGGLSTVLGLQCGNPAIPCGHVATSDFYCHCGGAPCPDPGDTPSCSWFRLSGNRGCEPGREALQWELMTEPGGADPFIPILWLDLPEPIGIGTGYIKIEKVGGGAPDDCPHNGARVDIMISGYPTGC
jgi:hypothetical protein